MVQLHGTIGSGLIATDSTKGGETEMRSVHRSLALVLAAVLLVAGCGGAAKKEAVTITFWHGMAYDSVHGKTIQALVKKFNESQKEVIVEETYQGSYADLEKKAVAAIAAQTPPTVLQNTDSMLTNLVKAKALSNLTNQIPAADKADIPAAMIEAQTFDGKLYALPFNKSVIVLIYDKTLVPNPPKTWEEFAATAKAVTQPGKVYGTVIAPSVWGLSDRLVQSGGQWTTADRTKATFNSEAGVKALEYVVNLVKDGVAIQLKPKEYESNYFNEGRVAMITATTASFAYIKPNNGHPWGVALMPKGPANDKVGLSGANVSIVDSAKPEEKAAALKFLLWLTGKEATLQWATAKTGYMPVRKSAVNAQEWKDFVKANPEYEVVTQAIDKGTVHPNHPQWGNVQKLLTTAVEKALLGQATPKQALDEAAAGADELLVKK